MPAEEATKGNSEIALIERITARLGVRPGVARSIGDDAAVLDGDPPVVLSQDLLVEGVHFARATMGWADVGHRALAVNLSDLAAMGADPVAALVGLGLPERDGPSPADLEALYDGMEALAAAHGLTVAGGDVTSAPAMVIAVTVAGRMGHGIAPLGRDTAEAGDLCCVTGTLGAAAAGLLLVEDPRLGVGVPEAEALAAAHRRPTPRLAGGRALASPGGAAAMLDCSDGLALDAGRIADASGLGVVIRLEDLPVAPGVAAVAAAAGRPPDVLAATGGEDFELVAAVDPARLDEVRSRLDVPLTVVGRFTAGGGVRLLRHGVEVHPRSLGWEHRV